MAKDKMDKTDDVVTSSDSQQTGASAITPIVSSSSYMPRQSRAMTSINSAGSIVNDLSTDDSGVGVHSDNSVDASATHLPSVPHNTPQSATAFPQQQIKVELQKVQSQLEQQLQQQLAVGSAASVPVTGAAVSSAKLPRPLIGQGSMSQPLLGFGKNTSLPSSVTPQQQQRSAHIQQQLFVRPQIFPIKLKNIFRIIHFYCFS